MSYIAVLNSSSGVALNDTGLGSGVENIAREACLTKVRLEVEKLWT